MNNSDKIDIIFRSASIKDGDLLLKWRNDPQVRKASITQEIIDKKSHLLWLKKVLDNNAQNLYIVEKDGAPVGTVRSDMHENLFELSWTVAPDSRGKGVGKNMVLKIAETITHPIIAKIRKENKASIQIASSAGMEFIEEEDGVLLFRREAVEQR